MTIFIKLVGLKNLRMPNCSIEAKQKVVSLYHKGYNLFSISKATSVPKSICWDIVRRYKSRGPVKNRKNPGRPKNLDSKEEKRLINLSENDPKKNSTQLLWHLNPKKSCSTSLIRRILISYHLRARIAIKKNLSYVKKSTCQRSLGKRTRVTFQSFLAKCAVFGRNNSGTAP